MNVGVIGAMQVELEYLLDHLENTKEEKYGTTIYVAKVNDNNVYIIQCGVGKVNASIAASLLAIEYKCDLIINTGIAGGTFPLQTRDVILGKNIGYHDVNVTQFGYPYGQIPGMPDSFSSHPHDLELVKNALGKLNIEYKEANIYTGDQFVSSLEQIKNVNDQGFACEMEGAAIAHTASKLGVGFIVLRFISDIVGRPSQIESYAEFEEEMGLKSAKICLNVLNNL